MAKSTIYMVNTSAQALAVGSTINLGNIIRRFGCNLNSNGAAINVSGQGYYKVDANFTITSTTAGTVIITMLKDNVAIEGATTSASLEVGDVVTISLDSVIREFGCCYDNNSNLTFVISGVPETINNVSVIVEKV